jgi:hypothetical protein
MQRRFTDSRCSLGISKKSLMKSNKKNKELEEKNKNLQKHLGHHTDIENSKKKLIEMQLKIQTDFQKDRHGAQAPYGLWKRQGNGELHEGTHPVAHQETGERKQDWREEFHETLGTCRPRVLGTNLEVPLWMQEVHELTWDVVALRWSAHCNVVDDAQHLGRNVQR